MDKTVDKGGVGPSELEGGHDYTIQERNSRSDGIITSRGSRIEFKLNT